MGLVEAASRFKPELGIAFSTFSYPRISGAINDYLRELGWGKKSDPVASVSLDIPNEQGVTKADLIEAKADQGQEELFEAITVNFNDQAKEMLRNYFIDESSMREVGQKFNVSESRISQLIKQYKDRIRKEWAVADLAA
jgi:RNA polymerase sigma factor (sigma-70 family)